MTPLPAPQFADVNGIRLAYYEAGPRGGVPIVFCDDAAFGQHANMRARTGDVFDGHTFVHVNAGIDRFHDLIGLCGKTTAPHFLT